MNPQDENQQNVAPDPFAETLASALVNKAGVVAQEMNKAQTRHLEEWARRHDPKNPLKLSPLDIGSTRRSVFDMMFSSFNFDDPAYKSLSPIEKAVVTGNTYQISDNVDTAFRSAGFTDGVTTGIEREIEKLKATLKGDPPQLTKEELEKYAERIFQNPEQPQIAKFEDIDPEARQFLMGMAIARVFQGGGASAAFPEFMQSVEAARQVVQQDMLADYQRRASAQQASQNQAKLELETTIAQNNSQRIFDQSHNQMVGAQIRDLEAQKSRYIQGRMAAQERQEREDRKLRFRLVTNAFDVSNLADVDANTWDQYWKYQLDQLSILEQSGSIPKEEADKIRAGFESTRGGMKPVPTQEQLAQIAMLESRTQLNNSLAKFNDSRTLTQASIRSLNEAAIRWYDARAKSQINRPYILDSGRSIVEQAQSALDFAAKDLENLQKQAGQAYDDYKSAFENMQTRIAKELEEATKTSKSRRDKLDELVAARTITAQQRDDAIKAGRDAQQTLITSALTKRYTEEAEKFFNLYVVIMEQIYGDFYEPKPATGIRPRLAPPTRPGPTSVAASVESARRALRDAQQSAQQRSQGAMVGEIGGDDGEVAPARPGGIVSIPD